MAKEYIELPYTCDWVSQDVFVSEGRSPNYVYSKFFLLRVCFYGWSHGSYCRDGLLRTVGQSSSGDSVDLLSWEVII